MHIQTLPEAIKYNLKQIFPSKSFVFDKFRMQWAALQNKIVNLV